MRQHLGAKQRGPRGQLREEGAVPGVEGYENTNPATAKSLQSCPCPPDFPVPGILQARTLEWGAIFFPNA